MMGRAKKIKKKVQGRQTEALSAEMNVKKEGLETRLRQYMAEERFADALETLAELIQIKDVQPGFLYDGAYAYFMLGDYERAAQWVDNVLTYDKMNLRARTLLARICILEDRVEEGLAIFEFVLKTGKGNLPDEMQEEIEDVVSYYVRRDPAKIRQEYPHIAEFMEAKKAMPADGKNREDMPSAAGNPKEILQALRDKVIGNQKQEGIGMESHLETLPAQSSEEEASAKGGSAREILQALRDKVLQGNAGHKSVEPEAKTEPVTSAQAEKEPEMSSCSKAQPMGECVSQKKQLIMQQKISLREKVKALNAFAGECYYRKDLAGAKELLTEALYIDSADSMTVKNLAYVLLEQGEREKAFDLVTQAKATDFALIRLLRDA